MHFVSTATQIVVAADSSIGGAAATSFLDTDAGHVLRAFLGIIGLLVFIGAAYKAAHDFSKGDWTKAGTKLFGGLIALTILINPQSVFTASNVAGNVIDKVISSVGQTANDAGGSATP